MFDETCLINIIDPVYPGQEEFLNVVFRKSKMIQQNKDEAWNVDFYYHLTFSEFLIALCFVAKRVVSTP